MILRPAIPTDLPAIAEIQAACPEASQWNPSDYFNYNCWVAERDRLCGFVVTRQTAPGENEVLNLAVAPDCRRGGVGRALLDAALEAWVEKAQAPDSIIAARPANAKTPRTHPLCPWPQVAKYKGSGSVDEAQNFSCVKP